MRKTDWHRWLGQCLVPSASRLVCAVNGLNKEAQIFSKHLGCWCFPCLKKKKKKQGLKIWGGGRIEATKKKTALSCKSLKEWGKQTTAPAKGVGSSVETRERHG